MIYEFKNFYEDPFKVMKLAKKLDYPGQDYNGVHFPAFSEFQDKNDVLNKLQELFPERNVKVSKTLFRKGTESAILIHHDGMVNKYIAVTYLSIGNQTAFWKNKFTGFPSHFDDKYIEYIHILEGNDVSRWDLIGMTDGEFNSTAIFPADWFHSIYPFENRDDRLTQVTFFSMENEDDKDV